MLPLPGSRNVYDARKLLDTLRQRICRRASDLSAPVGVAVSFLSDSDMKDTCTICSSGSLLLAVGSPDVGTVLGLPVEK